MSSDLSTETTIASALSVAKSLTAGPPSGAEPSCPASRLDWGDVSDGQPASLYVRIVCDGSDRRHGVLEPVEVEEERIGARGRRRPSPYRPGSRGRRSGSASPVTNSVGADPEGDLLRYVERRDDVDRSRGAGPEGGLARRVKDVLHAVVEQGPLGRARVNGHREDDVVAVHPGVDVVDVGRRRRRRRRRVLMVPPRTPRRSILRQPRRLRRRQVPPRRARDFRIGGPRRAGSS